MSARIFSSSTWPDKLRSGAAAHASLLLTASLLAAALMPTLVTPIPAMVDYVNHLARMYLLAADGTDPSPFYHVAWGLYPNLAMDLVVPPLARLVGVETAARIFLMASQVLIVTGAGALELVVKRRLAIAGPIAALFLFSIPFAWGFVNFEFALGLALWGIAAWIALRDRNWGLRLGAHTIAVVLLFVGHFFALGIYGFTLGVHELWSAWRRRASLSVAMGTTALLAAPAAVALGVMFVSGGSIGEAGNVWELATKPLWISAVLNGYSLGASRVEAACLVVLICALLRTRAIRPLKSAIWLAAGFALLYVAVPSRLLDTAYSDVRVLVAAALIVPAFLDVTFPSGFWRTTAAAIVGGCALANVGITASVFRDYSDTYDAMIASFAKLGTGARVLVGHSGEAEDPPTTHLADYPLYHAPTLAVHYAKAFVPTLFTTTGKQPLIVTPALRNLAVSCRGPVPVSVLVEAARSKAPAATPAFVRKWTNDFDYLYLIGDGKAPNPLPKLLKRLQTGPRFTLYRIGNARENNGQGEIDPLTVTVK